MIGKYMDSRLRREVLGKIGHRGLFLLSLGMFDIFYGLYLVLGGQLQFPLQLSNLTWGWVWTVTGAILAIGAFVRRDGAFFAAAVLLKTAWALEFVRLAAETDSHQWTRAASWAFFAIVALVASAWPEPGNGSRNGAGAVARAESVRNGEGD